ncbi:MAG: TetR/AcrR family transcriptional regulator [Paracoccaceae bacterium]
MTQAPAFDNATAPLAERGWRGSADLWLDAAYDALLEGGVGAVKLGPLAAKLGLSRTSFYWHFADREALLAGLIARWQGRNTGNLIARTESYAETIAEAVLNVNDCWITPELFDARMEFAIRSWGQGAPPVAAALAEADLARLAALRAMFLRFNYTEAQADIRARTIYLTQIGYISMRTEEALGLRLQRIPTYVEAFTGTVATEAEVARFVARHQGRVGAER